MRITKVKYYFLIAAILIWHGFCFADSFRIGADIGSFRCLNEVINGSDKYLSARGQIGFGDGLQWSGWGEYQYKWAFLRLEAGQVDFKREMKWQIAGNEYTLQNKLHYYPVKAIIGIRLGTANSRMNPFMGAGVGYYNIKWSEDGADTNTINSQRQTIGWQSIIGVDYKIAEFINWSLACEFSYINTELVLHLDDYHSRYPTITYPHNNFGGVAIKTGVVLNVFRK